MILNTLNRLIEIPSTDPNDARRRKLLNILLFGITILLLFALFFYIIAALNANNLNSTSEMWQIFSGSVVLLIGMVVIFFLNKYWSGKIASTIFLILITLVFVFSDSLVEISNGRSLFAFTIPIIMASVLLAPASSFIFSALSSVIVSAIAISIGIVPNIPAIGGYFVVAFISWLSARSLEQALKELRQINVELDHRVEDRTRELSAALARELVEAGKNRAILEAIADGVIVFDAQGKSIVANPALSRLLDMPSASLYDVHISELFQTNKISPMDRKTIFTMLRDPQRSLSSVRFRWGDRTLLVNAALVKIDLGDAIGTVAVFRDFTREAEVERMKNTFVAMVSHELRTPLNAIIGYAEMIREAVYGPILPRQAGIMERIENSSKRLLSLVSDLLDQAQIEAGRMKVHLAEFQVSDLLDSLHAVLDKQAAEKGLTLTTEIEPGMPSVVLGDFNRLHQILLNLGGNAVKFTESGGVTVRIYRVDERYWGFEVTDTGSGISAEARGYVFESFRQVERVVTREHGGIGLGLAIVKSLVELMGGQISLVSIVGKGTTFTVSLPFERSKEKTK